VNWGCFVWHGGAVKGQNLTIDKSIENVLAITVDQVVDVSENSAIRGRVND